MSIGGIFREFFFFGTWQSFPMNAIFASAFYERGDIFILTEHEIAAQDTITLNKSSIG